jgi:hypothetical protein
LAVFSIDTPVLNSLDRMAEEPCRFLLGGLMRDGGLILD